MSWYILLLFFWRLLLALANDSSIAVAFIGQPVAKVLLTFPLQDWHCANARKQKGLGLHYSLDGPSYAT